MSQVNLRSEVFWLIEGIFFINWYAIATYALSWLIETLGRLSACLFTTGQFQTSINQITI